MVKLLAVSSIIVLVIMVGIYYLVDNEKKALDEKERNKLGGSYISLSDGVTHYKLSGPIDGHLVVLVHGGTVPMWTWDSQIRALNDGGKRVLVYDKYGRGYSDRPKIVYNQELYKRQLLELVDKLELKDHFDLVGLSLGGGTAVNFSAEYPDRVQRLVLISPLIKNYKIPGILKVPILGELFTRLFGIRIISKRFTSLFEGNTDKDKYKTLFKAQTTYKGFQWSLLSMLKNNAVGDYTGSYERFGKQEREILLIWGSEDTEITKEMIIEIKQHLPNLKFETVENVGHGIVFQRSEVINSLLLHFLK